MSNDIVDPKFWKDRVDSPTNQYEHQSIFKCTLDQWKAIVETNRKVLAAYVGPTDSILDCGCGYGRLLDIMPDDWQGCYVGIDIAPVFIELAQTKHPEETFILDDLRNFKGGTVSFLRKLKNSGKFDIAIVSSMRPMVTRNMGEEVWLQMRDQIIKVANHILYIECSTSHLGELESWY